MTAARRTLRAQSVTVVAPGSSANLGPGFDSLALALDVHLRVTVTPLDHGAEQLTVHGEGAGEIGLDARNRFLIGLERGLQEFELEPPVMRVEMHNEIPLARGLGSSAAAAVAGLLAAGELAGAPLAADRVLAIAADIDGHADNAAASCLGGFVIVRRAADGTPRAARFEPPANLEAVVFVPDMVLNTAAMRAALPSRVAHADAALTVGGAAMVVAALAGGRPELLDAMSDDRLHEPYRAKEIPAFPELVAAARSAGARGAALSGAGSAVLALCEEPATAQRTADAMAAAAARAGLAGRSLVLRPAAAGARVVPSSHAQ